MRNRKPLYLYLVLGFLVFIFMSNLSFYGPRGSDQFWYMQETEALLTLNKPISNYYYAGYYWRDGFNEKDNYFIHHNLAHYIVLPFASVFGVYAGWIFTSVLSILLGTFLLIRAAYKATMSHKVAVLAGMIFLLLPITAWQSFNILQESIIAAYMCCGVWIWERSVNAKQHNLFYNVIGGLFGAVGVFIHPIFTIWCIGWMLKIFLDRENIRSLRLWSPSCVTLFSLLAAQYFKNIFFPTEFFPTLGAMISNNSMTYYFDYQLHEPTFQMIRDKALTALNQQFAVKDKAIMFFYPFNALLGLFFAAIVFNYKKHKIAGLTHFILPIFLLAAFFCMISLHQNQFRYNLIITPIILIAVVMVFGKFIATKLSDIRVKFGIMLLFSLFIITDVYLSHYIAKDARADAVVINQIKQGMPDASRDQKVLFVFKSLDLSIGWSLYPRSILYLPAKNLQSPESIVVVRKFNPRYVMIQKTVTDDVEKNLPLVLKKVPFEPGRLFEVIEK